MNKKIILGIESSCDDTSAAVISDGYILSNIVSNQKVHQQYGGVVPELASRAHQQNIIPVVDTILKKLGINKEDHLQYVLLKDRVIRFITGYSSLKSFV